jgi:hypothetical protein
MTRIDMLKWLKGWELVVLIVGWKESSIGIIRLRMAYYGFLLFLVIILAPQGEGIDLRW